MKKVLSQVRKEVPIKNVVQVIPLYVMLCFLLPTNIINSLKLMVHKFFGRGSEGKKKICFNFALLARKCWRIIKSPSSLVTTCLQEKYYPTGNFLTSLLGRLRHRIGNVKSTSISKDKWISTLKELSPLSFHISRGSKRKVVDLIDYNQCC
ncbi:hypothetical protein M9H77_28329 [Catharanthus roseus]|uniref:Uncharacterized protein n=1 Tax=Catharanthus roseus TaxID=4058 RepID=A0ACC0AJ59_CATRO|nr:hypothetical protein M9H77_28329 [Catharanthus roseus]